MSTAVLFSEEAPSGVRIKASSDLEDEDHDDDLGLPKYVEPPRVTINPLDYPDSYLATATDLTEGVLWPSTWLETERVRFALARLGNGDPAKPFDGRASALKLVRDFGEIAEDSLVGYQLAMLSRSGLVEPLRNAQTATYYRLTRTGVASLYEPGPRKPAGVTWAKWAAAAAYAVSRHHGVTAHEMYRVKVGAAVTARSRLSAMLLRAGWSTDAAARGLGLDERLCLVGAARWVRIATAKVESARAMRKSAIHAGKTQREAA
jgi:hypothetical protein